ncbi:hypothetical protein A9Q99_15165 [Gammaproteobacteria bacterium 45_16_T64]|nr:hypothetical protein A9Q99_15165 [Gammaproteobacteria bacterium 45_16_T64]
MHMVAKAYTAQAPLYSYPVELARKRYETNISTLDTKARASVSSRDRTITLDTKAGHRSIGIRIYTPSNQGSYPKPVMVYYHGGGWTVGSVDSVDALCSGFAEDLDHIVVSVDYRLAPEHKFPAPADDAVDSFLWVQANAAHYGGDCERVYVAGDSAGGNLAAVVCQQTVLQQAPVPCAQVLIYPSTDLRMRTLSHHSCGEGLPLSKVMVQWFVGNYIRQESDKTQIKVSPGLADPTLLAQLPPALVTTAGFDVLRDEGEAYAKMLAAAGVSVEHKEYSNTMHAYVSMVGTIPTAKAAVEDTTRRIAELKLPSGKLVF